MIPIVSSGGRWGQPQVAHRDLSPDNRWITFNAEGNEHSRIYIAPVRMSECFE